MAVALQGVLFLACLFAGPVAVAGQAGAAPAATALTTRGVVPPGAREHSQLTAAVDRPAISGHGSTLFAALLGALVLAATPVAGFLAAGERTGQLSRRTPGTRRDRAPPARALA